MKDASRISALINLLDDPDETIFSQVSQELLSFGDQVVSELEDAWENSFNEILQLRIESIIHQIQFQEVKNRLTDWKNGESHSLLEAAIILTHYQYSELDEKAIRQTVDNLYKQCWLEMNPDYTALEKVGVLNKVFFELNGFSGNKEDYNAPRKSYINNVLQSKKGNPISICMLYLELAERLKLPIYGVNLPEHFVVAYLILPLQYLDTVDDESVLFYIDPFNKGSLFQRSDIEDYLKKLKIDKQDKFFMPCEKMTVVNRMINNLMFGYNKNGQLAKVEELKILKNCLK
ncbi:transglutaminase-like domain-containing protein [Vicingaceae bacterium]|nr:transglutaminase-like domain-containing protein [Vicingaceae bacterium]MDB4060648.1 transglutaminase-like domain-containing protein [Vicingaceae bacterium]